MKLNWFSPLPEEQTAIAQYSDCLLPGLAEAFEVTAYAEGENPRISHNPGIPVHPFKHHNVDWKEIHRADHQIYHVGNNFEFHGEIIQMARRCPGIVVMHDLSIYETVMNWHLYKGAGQTAFLDELFRYYGEEAVTVSRQFLEHHDVDINDISKSYPFHQYAIRHQTGIITHNPLNIDALRAASRAPLLYAPLPYQDMQSLHPAITRNGQPPNGRYRIVFFGFLGSRNRRVLPFLEAFSKFPGKDSFEIALAGIYPEDDVDSWIRKFQLANHVVKFGYMDDEGLDDLLRCADIAVNLRWPSRGESSHTLLRAWNASLPTMLTRTAYYETIPDSCACFVEPDAEEESILQHLAAFLRDPTPYRELGLNGRKRLASEHSTEAFVAYLQPFLQEVRDYAGSVYPARAVNRFADQLTGSAFPSSVRHSLVNTVGRELASW